MRKIMSSVLIRIANLLNNSDVLNKEQIDRLNYLVKADLVNFYLFSNGAQKYTKNMLEIYAGLNPKAQYYKQVSQPIKQFVQKIIDTVPQQILQVLSRDMKSYNECVKRFPKIKQNLEKLNSELQKQVASAISKIMQSQDCLQKIVNEWKI